ncbi:hypothetical protein BC834DRAFT_323884 [Gloeopeniophorella convolvens]|nr:hypothetical protein BC834DRAFT_323884 [Gloeopeniophorella convolvens]
MQALALYWEMLPFCLFIGIPVLVLMRVPSHPVASFSWDTSATLLSWLLCGISIPILPEKWRIWKRIWVWHPIRRFFHRYGFNYPAPGRYRELTTLSLLLSSGAHLWTHVLGLFGKAGFILGLLSGVILLGPGAFLLQLHFLTQKGRAAQDTSP